jgi:hypothetical protein
MRRAGLGTVSGAACLAAGLALAGCASLPTLTERPEAYHLYRATRVAPTLEERLRAADRYLREAPGGPHTEQVRAFYEKEEEKYFLHAFNRLPNLYAYAEALPQGPHIEDVHGRIVFLEAKLRERSRRDVEDDAKAAAMLAQLASADTKRRAFVGVVKDWAARLLAIQSFGEPTSELADETIFAFRLSEPRGACQGDHCRKLLELSYPVPGQRELVERAAVIEIQLELEAGLLSRARLAGPELWTRLAEALSLKPLPKPTPEERADAVSRAAMLMRALLERRFPAAECDVPAAAPAVVVRRCHGLSAVMQAASTPTEDDVLEIAPLGP